MIQDSLELSVVSVFDELAQFIINIESDTKGASKFDTQTNDIPTAVEQETLKIMGTLQKLKFEIFGLLRKSKVELSTTVPPITKISRELQIDLLKIPELNGCGVLFDQLVLHTSQTFPEPSKQTITDLLKKHGYSDSYRVEIIETIKETACAQGSEIIAEYTMDYKDKNKNKKVSDYLFGTLGCFVNVTEVKENAHTKTILHGITCAHCIMDCHPEIFIQDYTEDNEIIIAQRSKHVYSENSFDIASIEIQENDYIKCDKALVDDDGYKSDSWTFCDKVPGHGDPVYRFEPTAGFTRGLIVSNNYVSNQVKEKHKDIISEHKDSFIIVHEANFMRDTNDQTDICGSFSEEGDSGSVVCLEDSKTNGNKTNGSRVVALIHGGLKVQDKDTKIFHMYSLAFPIKTSITELEGQFSKGCTIEPARNTDS